MAARFVRLRLVVAASICLFLRVPASGAVGVVVPVTSCSGSIDRGEIGVLQHDITCQHEKIVILLGGVLDLNGFTITKIEDDIDVVPSSQEAAVFCDRQCKVISSAATPGRIVGPGRGVHDELVGVEGGGYYDGAIGTRRMRVENVEIRDFDSGIRAELARIQLRDVAVHGCQTGIGGFRITAESLVLTGNFMGTDADRVRATDVECTDSTFRCIHALGVMLDDVTVSGSETGVFGTRVRVTGGVLENNAVDIASFNMPRLAATSCRTSRRLPEPPPASWGVCSLDP